MATPDFTNLVPRELGTIQAPVTPLVIGNNGAFKAVRESAAQGSCGTSGYPCRHPGLDANGSPGQYVKAPENGIVVAIADGGSAPFVGYGPWVVIIKGDASGKFQFFGHLDPKTAPLAVVGQRVQAGQPIGTISSANHTHWELRTRMVPAFASGENNFTNNVDPLAWLHSQQGGLLPVVIAGGVALAAAWWWKTRR